MAELSVNPQQWERGPKIVAVGGGTGLSTMLRGLKKYTKNLTAVVTVADDGGGSGMLRRDMGMPPPGDIRHCMEALANTEPIMQKLLTYRFTEGSLAGQSFGNLILAALNGVTGSFEEAVSQMSQVLAITGQAADLLLRLDNGDAALLYLHLLRRGTVNDLNWPQPRLSAALSLLRGQGLAPQEVPEADPPAPEAPPPEYALEDLNAALNDKASSFPALCDEVERRLGKKLSANDLRVLYTLFDHLALPAEVILMLVGWCTEEMERKYGPGRKPFLSQIRREGFAWARRGIDTMERAEAHIQRLTQLRSREGEVLRLLDIPARPLVEREKTYIAAWDDMGFDDEAIRMAYEKTVLKKRSMDWGYMNGILRRWHEKGLHTAAAIQAGDRDPRPLEKLVRAFNRQEVFQLNGPDYVRSKGQVSDLLRPWYQKKSLTLSHEVPLDESLYSPDFASRVTEDLKTLLPFYRYFAALCAAAE